MIADPVFVDRSGRRRRLIVAGGAAGTLALLLTAVALAVGFTGTGPAAVPGWPDAAPDGTKPPVTKTSTARRPPVASGAATTPAPPPTTTPSVVPSITPSAVPSVAPSAVVPTHGKGRGHFPSAHPSRKK